MYYICVVWSPYDIATSAADSRSGDVPLDTMESTATGSIVCCIGRSISLYQKLQNRESVSLITRDSHDLLHDCERLSRERRCICLQPTCECGCPAYTSACWDILTPISCLCYGMQCFVSRKHVHLEHEMTATTAASCSGVWLASGR
jgi:hypothetical protein